MTRSSVLALVTLFAGLLSFASVTAVSAGSPCIESAQRQCAAVAVADNAILSHATIATYPVHVLSGRGMGQEHFEAMVAAQITVFSIAAPTPVHILSCTGYAREHCEAMTAQIANP